NFAHSKGFYLGAGGERNLGIMLTKVEKVKVTIAKIYANNIQEFMRRGQSYGYDYDENYYSEGNYVDRSYNYYNHENYGNVISEKTYSVKALPKSGNQHLLHLNLSDLEFTHDLKGMFVVKVEDSERRWLQVSRLV